MRFSPCCPALCCLLLANGLLHAQTIVHLWPGAHSASSQEKDTTTDTSDLIAGKRVQRITDVTDPTLAVYRAPVSHNGGAAVVVLPGGGYRILAYDLEGTEVCEWLNSAGVNCLLLKYRVPNAGPYPAHSEDLADAQRAVRMARQHAAEWGIDPKRVGVLGFSAGGHLAAVLSNHADAPAYQPVDSADTQSAQPAFALLIYPGGLVHSPQLAALGAEVTPSAQTPPTFLVQAEDDPVHVENTLAYYAALATVKAPSEMHVYAKGGHGYGLRASPLAITSWPVAALGWLRGLGMAGE